MANNLTALNTNDVTEYKLITVFENGIDTTLSINVPVLLIAILLTLIGVLIVKWLFGWSFKNFLVDEITLKDPYTGSTVKIKANKEDRKVAHKIWTELVTRKAAIPFEKNKDVIIEVYDSWHTLFQCVREQISLIPIEKMNGREKKDIEALIDISISVLNEGLRPHLTQWQAKFRAWYTAEKEVKPEKSPQEIQENYPHYEELVDDIILVNEKLISWADELKKLARA